MKIISQMDEISSIKIKSDSTFALLLEAQNRGYEIYYYVSQSLSLENGVVSAFVHKLKLQDDENNHYQILSSENFDLSKADIILVRQDPPFDMNYLTTTYILEKIKNQVLIVNDPTEIRNAPEKILVTNFPDLMPPTLISADLERIKEFHQTHGEIVLKPLYGYGGNGIFHLKKGDDNLNIVFKTLINDYKTAVVAQKFLPEVKQGDKRILLLDGEIIGAINRVPNDGEIRSNLAIGGVAYKTEITQREQEICDIIGPELKKRGLVFVGIDVISGFITEINVTSPTGIRAFNRLHNTNIEKLIWDCLEKKSSDKSLF